MVDNYIFGIHPLAEALDSGQVPEKILIQKDLTGEGFTRLFQRIRQLKIPFQMVPVEKLNRVTRKNHQGIIAFVSLIAYHELHVLLPGIFERGELPLIVLLDGVTDVRNMGAIARTAECAGAHAIVIPEKGNAPVSADAIKASAGALSRIPVCKEDSIPSCVAFLKECGLTTIALSEKSGKTIYETDFNKPLAIVMGSEEKGVSSMTKHLVDAVASIPMAGKIASLNVSVATGIVLFEINRQRNT